MSTPSTSHIIKQPVISFDDFVILGNLALWKQKKNPVKLNFKVAIVFDIIQSFYAEFSKIKKKNTLKTKKQTKASWTVLTEKKKKKKPNTFRHYQHICWRNDI